MNWCIKLRGCHRAYQSNVELSFGVNINCKINYNNNFAGYDISQTSIILADVNDEESLSSMCRLTKMVLNCVGPVSIMMLLPSIKLFHAFCKCFIS